MSRRRISTSSSSCNSNSYNHNSRSSSGSRKRGLSDSTSTIDVKSELQAFAVTMALTRYGMLEDPVFDADIYPTDLADECFE